MIFLFSMLNTCLALLLLFHFGCGENSSGQFFTLPRETVDGASIFTTASDEFLGTDDSPKLLQRIPPQDEKKWKRQAALRQLAELDYGPKISKVLQYINTKRNYDKRVRPNYGGRPVNVTVSMYVCAVSQVSEINMDVTLDFYFRQLWRDPRLDFSRVWNEELVVGGEFMRELWRPDSFFVNAKLSQFHEVTKMNTFIRISPSGNITQSLRLTVTASCPMNLRYFPMDSQQCSLEIASYGYTTKDINLVWARSDHTSVGFASEVHKLPQFRIRGHRETYSLHILSTGNFSRLIVDIFFERSFGYYIIQVYIPCMLVVIMSQISFWIDRKSEPARVAFGITTVLTMTTLISSTNANVAKISYLKAIDVYLFMCFIMTFAALLEYAAVDYARKRWRMKELTQLYDQVQLFQTTSPRRSIAIAPSEEDPGGWCNCCRTAMLRASDIEKYSRIIFPSIFVCFNIAYWIIYLSEYTRPNKVMGFELI